MLGGRRVLLAVTGGVAAYKTAYLARRLVELDADVRVILTESAHEFVGPQTFAAITGYQPHTTLFGDESVSPHTELARWAELIVVAPATAATIARIANGLSVDLVSATILAYTGPVLVAPAMHTEMWEHPATRRNIETLHGFGYHMIGPETGSLAGGDTGVGRVAEPDDILEAIERLLVPSGMSRSILVTAGGTREPVDPVRFLGNRSSGKMGHAIANEAARRGMSVTLVTTSDLTVLPSVKVVPVETAQEMLDAVSGVDAEIAVMAAAVADFRPKAAAEHKLKKADGVPEVVLEPTPDILAALGASKRPGQVVVGFAAETEQLRENAAKKLAAKRVDLMVANDVSAPDAGFSVDTNRALLLGADGSVEETALMSKEQLAGIVLERVAALLGATPGPIRL
jgi:phosphopantothenoylcysteine decarboxylase/phosphopantothenate--cysteine ligase